MPKQRDCINDSANLAEEVGFVMKLMIMMVDRCPDLVQSHQHDALKAWDQLKNEEKNDYKKSRIDSSKGSDLNIKGLRETLGRIYDIYKYFCKNDCCKKWRRLYYIIIEFYQKNYPLSQKPGLFLVHFANGWNYNKNVARYNIKNTFNFIFPDKISTQI